MLDIAIKNGMIIDGTGNPWFRGDVGIRQNKIERIGRSVNDAQTVLNAEGFVVSPGFIDMHSHSDTVLLANPVGPSKVMQGVTTEVSGNCGVSPAPVVENRIEDLRSRLPSLANERWNWRTLREYFGNLSNTGLFCNICPLVGAGTIRIAVMGLENREPTKKELQEMKKLLHREMVEGAFGLSTGLIYPPGCFTTTDELIEIASVLHEYDGIYASHVRGEAGTLVDGIKEALKIGEAAKVKVQVSHHKACGKRNWGRVRETLQLMDQARQGGLDVTCDQYPYTASSTHLITACLPPWVHGDGVSKLLVRLKDSNTRHVIKEQIKTKSNVMGWDNVLKENGWDSVILSRIMSRQNKALEGKSLKEIVERRGGDPFDSLFDLFLEEGCQVNGAMGVMFQMSEQDVETVMTHPISMVGSDGSALSISKLEGKPHPRSYGTYPRVLGKYVREKKILTMEAAIRKMTSFPAQKLGLKNRGLIKEGYSADIVVFNPETIIDKATYEEPLQYPTGIEYVIVNGEVVVDHGKLKESFPGLVLTR